MAGLEVLRSNSICDPKRIAAIGYCFGGTCVLELARNGADIAGILGLWTVWGILRSGRL